MEKWVEITWDHFCFLFERKYTQEWKPEVEGKSLKRGPWNVGKSSCRYYAKNSVLETTLVVVSIARFRFSRFPPETSGLIFLFSLLLFSDETTKITIWQQKSFLCMNLKRTSKAWISICIREALERMESKSQDKRPFVCFGSHLADP